MLINKDNVNHFDKEGKTLLHYACADGNIDLVKFLIEIEAKVNQATNDGRTPIYIASENGKSAIVKELILKGADPSLPKNDGMNPIIIASKNGHHDVVEELIKEKVNVNQATINGDTSILLASREGHSKVVAKLIEAKADLTTNKKNGLNPIFLAVENNRLGVVKEFINAEVIDLNQLGSRSDAAPFITERYGNVVETLLHIAAEKGFTKVVQALLAGGANVDQPNIYDITPLHLAAREKSTGVDEALLGRGADPTDLHYAAKEYGYPEVYELLKKAQPEKPVNVKQGSAIGKFFKLTGQKKPSEKTEKTTSREPEAGIFPPLTPKDKSSPASALSQRPAMEGAKTREEDDIMALFNACVIGNIEDVKKLIRGGADVNKAREDGVTPLMMACIGGYLDIVKQLIQAGANVNQARKADVNQGEKVEITPIFAACLNGHKDVVELLFNKGADSKCLTKKIFGVEVIRNRIKAIFRNDPAMEELIKKITSDDKIKERDDKLKQTQPSPSLGTMRSSAKEEPKATRVVEGGYQALL
jgi:ankyrin repeat protein